MQQNQIVKQLAETISRKPGGALPDNLRMQIERTSSLVHLDELNKAILILWGQAILSDDQADELGELLEARRKILRGGDILAVRPPANSAQTRPSRYKSVFPPKRRPPASPNRLASIARRRTLAASGPMPSALAAKFTTGELAVMRIVADEIRDKKDCRLPLGAIAARAGVSVTTARRALRTAVQCGLLAIEERRRYLQPNLPNIVRILSSEWITWIKRGQHNQARRDQAQKSNRNKPQAASSQEGGRQKARATDKNYYIKQTERRSRYIQDATDKQNRTSKVMLSKRTC